MQWLFRLLTLVARLVAPLAAPAAANAPVAPAAADCARMDMGASSHRMPPSHHGAGESCCIAVPAGIGSPLVAVSLAPPTDHQTFIAVAQAFRLGAGPKADDPPPRTS
ncbi:MAG TPA: hypothetical protein VFT07_00440 [Sphingomicrobium sp.]|nr:hypothetical protein [Sphingomicrobium sp.]